MIRLASLGLLCLALAVPATASAATIAADPLKPCYRAGESLNLVAGGYTPGSQVRVDVAGRPSGFLIADGAGTATGTLTLGDVGGLGARVVSAIDESNPALVATTSLTVTETAVRLSPLSGRPGIRHRIRASGFAEGATLYAHIVRGRVQRTLRVGRLRGPCGALFARRRLLPQGSTSGIYRVQFDTTRRFSRATRPQVAYRVNVFQTIIRR